jgi:O-antigen/teichoic acid export membrane protein
MQLAFVPLYIEYLGIEAYGLIGIFAILQAWLVLLDLGMRPSLAREMARFTAGTSNVESIRDLLRSVELVAVAIGASVGLVIIAASGLVASHWIKSEALPPGAAAQAIALMGAVAALRFVENVYVSSLVGLQRQVLENVFSSSVATARGLGAVAVVMWVSPTIQAFFVWQVMVSFVSTVCCAKLAWGALPRGVRRPRFSMERLRGIWRFASGMTLIALLSLLLTQVDKVLLSRLLSLESFGYYALAGTVAGALYALVGPITTAYYPRLTQHVTRADQNALRAEYHYGSQLISVLMGSAAIVLIVFGDKVLLLWTADPELARNAGHILRVLAFGTLLNGLMWLPYQLQLAHGWTGLTVRVNAVAVAVLIPAILWVTPMYRAVGAAWVWVALNAGYLLIAVGLMHRRLLPAEKWRWYRQDTATPLLAGAATAWLCRSAMPADLGRLAEAGVLLVTAAAVAAAAAMAAPAIRDGLWFRSAQKT